MDVSSRLFKILVLAPGETEVTGLDVSPLVVSFDGGDSLLDQSGLISFTGSLALAGYPIGINIDTNPRSNRQRWARGNKVIVWLTDSSGDLQRVKTLYITKEPLPPYPGNPNLTLQVGDAIALLSYRQPPGDASGVSLGSGTSRTGVINNLLAKAGAGALIGTVPGTLSYAAQKLGNESYIQQAGKIAFAGRSVLWCDAEGNFRASQVALDVPRFALLSIGGSSGSELSYEPSEGNETPAEIVRATGTSYKITQTSNEETVIYNEEFGPAQVVDPEAGGTIVLLKERIRESWSGNERETLTTREEPKGIVVPGETQNRLALVTSLIKRERYIYEAASEGKLLEIRTESQRPFGAAAPEYLAQLPEGQQQANRYALIDAEESEAVYEYSTDEITVGVRTTTKETCAAILPNEEWASPLDLVVSENVRESWEPKYKGEWQYQKRTYQAIARAFPEIIDSFPEGTPPGAKLGVVLVSNQTQISNSGQTQPPAPDRRRPTHTQEEQQIEGEARFDVGAGSEFQERERTYDVPYANSSGELSDIAELLGKILIGRRQGQSWQIALTDQWLSNPEPLLRVDFNEPNGFKQSFLANGRAIAFNSRQCYIGATGIWLGSAKQTILPPGATVQPGQTVIEVQPDGSTVIEIVEPPYTPVIQISGGQGQGGEFKAYPYPLIAAAIAITAGQGQGGEFRRLLPPLDLTAGQGQGGEFIPIVSLTAGQGQGGEFFLPTSNIVNGQLSRYLVSDVGVTLDENDRVLSWSDNEPLMGMVLADEFESTSRPAYTLNGIHDQPVIRFNAGDFVATPLQGGNLLDLLSVASFACFAVFQVGEFGNGIAIVGDGFSWGIALVRGADGSFAVKGYHNTENGERGVVAEEILINTPLIVSFWKEAGSIYLQINDGAIASTSAEDIEAEGTIFQLGNFPFNTKGDIGAVLLYDLSLAESARELVKEELVDKFGIEPFPDLTSYFIATSGVEADGSQLVLGWNGQPEVVRRANTTSFGFQNPPLYASNAINGQPAIHFDTSIANYTFLICPALSQFIQADQFCCFVVFEASSIADVDNSSYTGGNEILSVYQTWGIDLRNVYDPGNQAFLGCEVAAYHSVASGFVEVSQPVSVNTPVVLSFWKEAGSIYLQVNDGAIASVAAGDLFSRFGQLFFGSSLFDGYLGAFVSYRTALPTLEREAVRDQLNTVFNCY